MIRQAHINDIDRIWELRLKASLLLKEKGVDQWQSIFPTKEQFLKDIEHHEFYVIDVDDEIVAMMALKGGNELTYEKIYDGQWHFDEPYMTIHRIAVDERYKQYRYSIKLLAFAKTVATKAGINYLRIDTHEDNKGAIKRFTSFGFIYCGYILLSEKHPTDRKRIAFDLRWE